MEAKRSSCVCIIFGLYLYADIFTGVGKLRDFQLKLHVKDNATPISQPVRRLPLGLRSKVDEKLDELLARDIIEEVSHSPTKWVISGFVWTGAEHM